MPKPPGAAWRAQPATRRGSWTAQLDRCSIKQKRKMIRPWFRQAAVPWKTTAHPDKSIWGESSLHQTRGAPEPDAVPRAYLVVNGQVHGDGLVHAAVGGAFVAGDGGPERVVRIGGAEGRERVGEAGGGGRRGGGGRGHGRRGVAGQTRGAVAAA